MRYFAAATSKWKFQLLIFTLFNLWLLITSHSARIIKIDCSLCNGACAKCLNAVLLDDVFVDNNHQHSTFGLMLVFRQLSLWKVKKLKISVKMAKNGNQGIMITLIKFFHLIAAIQFCFAVYYDFAFVHVPPNVLKINRNPFGGKFKFLTFLNAVSSKSFALFWSAVKNILSTNLPLLAWDKTEF